MTLSRILLVLFAAVSISLTACGDKDDTDSGHDHDDHEDSGHDD